MSNILVLGNGFDLAHGLPTKYSHFLVFLKAVDDFNLNINAQNFDEFFSTIYSKVSFECIDIKKVEDLKQDIPFIINQIKELMRDNIWVKYFFRIFFEKNIVRENWIDFEKEICYVIDFLDKNYSELETPINEGFCGLRPAKEILDFINCVKTCFDGNVVFKDFISLSFKHLQKLIRCLHIYLVHFVETLDIKVVSPDIQNIDFNFVLSFNYTYTMQKVYDLHAAKYHYIHGQVNDKLDDNLVLGVNEYWSGEDKNNKTNFNCYKKFVQRIMNSTGVDYKTWLHKMNIQANIKIDNLDINYFLNNAYIFGHSLDISDKDVIREILLTKSLKTTIFYFNNEQKADQIANLSKILGQETLLAKVFAHNPSIVFKQQQDMAFV